MMSDPIRNLCLCYTPIASYIVDLPEAAMLSGVQALTFHVTMAHHKLFGEPFCHMLHLGETMLCQLASIKEDPDNVEGFFKACKPFCLNGVLDLFFQDWPLFEPSTFFTPEPLHHGFGKFYSHDFKWCISAVGWEELDFCYLV